MGALRQSSPEENIERFNRASDFFGDPVQRWNDRLSLERHVQIENYRSGRMALILDCEFLIPRVFDVVSVKPEATRLVHDVELVGEMARALFIFKVDIVESHKLQKWNEKLMFIPDIQPVKCTKEIIPSLVGFYRVDDKSGDIESDLLLFQSAIYGTHKFFPGFVNWELCPIAGLAVAIKDDLVPHKIQSASEIVQCITDDKGNVTGRECQFVKSDSQVNKFPAEIVIDKDGVEIVRHHPSKQSRFNVLDVLLGPLNLRY